MKTLSLYLTFVVLSCLLHSCSDRNKSEEEVGIDMLGIARQDLADGRYAEARDTILSLRTNHPMAIEARRGAILLMDSVELLSAQDSLSKGLGDSEDMQLRVKFYQHKIEFDRKQLK